MLSNTSTLNADLIEKLETALDNSLTSDIPGAAVAIISPNGNWFGASGIADLANNTPLQPNDRFEIGSITKTFVAVTLLQLVEAGQLSLEDTLAEWLPASLTSGIPNADAITIKQILNHTSGIADYTNPLFVQAATNPLVFLEEWQPEQLVELIRGAEPVFAPGASWDYSNTNFILAGLVIESVTGNTIASEIRDRILTPLNLENTFFAGEEEIPGGYINGYWDFDQNNTLDDITVTNLSWAWAAGAIISNTADLATFAAGLFQGKLLAPDTLAQMLDTVPVNSPNYDSYGLGIGTIESPNRFWWIHRGQTLGFRSNLWYSPAEDITYVELINGRSSSNLAGTLLPTFRNGLTNNGDIMNYNETIDGDISGNPASPLALELAAGDNILRATSVAGDREYVTVTIPDGLQLDSVELDSYTSADEIAFAAVQRGDVFTEPPRQTNVANLLGYSHFGTTDLGSDILDNLGRGDGAIGFTSPLPSGNYTFWLQQTGEPATYTLNFNVSASNTPSPEPVVSLQTVTGAFGIDDKVLATSLVDELVTFETGTSVLSLVLSATGDIPADGLVVTIDTDVELSDYFGRLGRIPFTPGGEILEVLYDDTGKTTEIKFRMDAPNAVINLNAADDGNVDGVRQATFSLADGDGYAVKAGSGASTVQFYDTLAQVPQPTIVPEVGFTVDQTTLVETDGTAFTLNFTLSEAPPAEGVLVYVLSPQRGVLSEFDVLNAEVAGGVFPPANFQSSGFYFKITEQTASITLSAFNDGDQEGMEELTFAIQSGPGYTIAAGSDTVKLNVLDEVNSQIQVGLTTEPAVLVEADKTVSVHKFSLSATPPAQGLTVAVVAPNLSEFDLNGIVVEGGEIARLTPTGFDLKITAKEATIKLPVADDGTAEGIETAIFTLQDGSTYQVNPARSQVSLRSSIPPIKFHPVLSSGNRTIRWQPHSTPG